MSDHDEIIEENEEGGWKNYLAVVILFLAYAGAVTNVLVVQKNELMETGDRVVIRMTHWQLEAGVRDTFETMAREFESAYEKDTGIKLKVVQNPINEKAYKQYVQTQCIGGTAPDLVEVGFYDAAYTRRFFLSTSDYVSQPNPYNKGTELDGVAWADTFRDGMYSALDTETMEYYGAPLSMVTMRMFYNKKLLKEAMGTDQPPTNYREFIKYCTRLEEWAAAKQIKGFKPIAGSQYLIGQLLNWSINPLTFDLLNKSDLNYDGGVKELETLVAYVNGNYSEQSESLRKGHELLNTFTAFFPNGFMSQDRMEAGFRFSRSLGAFIVSGAWDANSYFQSADFPVGICSFPMPLRTDPEYGKYLSGPQSEAEAGGAMRFGVTKFSRHPDVATRFLMFLTSRKNNEWINKKFKWIPIIRGTKAYGQMVNFMPDPKGLWGWTWLSGGSKTDALYKQAYWEFFEHSITYDKLAENVRNGMPRAIASDLQESMRSLRERRLVMDATISWNYALETFAGDWGLPRDESKKIIDSASKRVLFNWESRAGSLNIQIPLLMKTLLQQDTPLVRQIKSFLTLDPFANN